MNILLVTLFSLERNTSVAISNLSITKGLLALGHRITWVMPNWAQCETLFDASMVRVIRIPGQDQKRNVGFIRNRIRSHFRFLDFTRPYLHQIKKTLVPEEYYDIVISTSDPKTSHVFTLHLLRRINYGRWIQHWGDPLFGDITRNLWWPKLYIRLYEWSILRKADRIIYVTPFTCDFQKEIHPKIAHKITFIPLPADMFETKSIQQTDVLRIAYLGDYNPTFRNLRPLYDACANMDGVYLTIAGHGPMFTARPNICILPRIPQSQALEIENEADVIICVCNLHGTQIPGKALYKASSDKHILIAIENNRHDEMRKYFESYNRFVVCDNTKESIGSAIQSLRSKTHNYATPEQLLPISVAKEILQLN